MLLKKHAEVTEASACAVYQWLREVCSTRLLSTPIKLGRGAGHIVQIDESLMRHKPKVMTDLIFGIKNVTNIVLSHFGIVVVG